MVPSGDGGEKQVSKQSSAPPVSGLDPSRVEMTACIDTEPQRGPIPTESADPPGPGEGTCKVDRHTHTADWGTAGLPWPGAQGQRGLCSLAGKRVCKP